MLQGHAVHGVRLTVNRIPMPKNRESARDGPGLFGSSNAEVTAPQKVDIHESTSQSKADDVSLPSIRHANTDEGSDSLYVAMEAEISAGEDIFDELYASRKELGQSTKPVTTSAEILFQPSNTEINEDSMKAVAEATGIRDTVGDQSASDCTVFLAASTCIESSVGNLEMGTIMKDSNREVYAAASPANDGIKRENSSCNEMIDAGTNLIQEHADPPLRTIFELVGLMFCRDNRCALDSKHC